MKADMAFNFPGEQRARVDKRQATTTITGRLPPTDLRAVGPERFVPAAHTLPRDPSEDPRQGPRKPQYSPAIAKSSHDGEFCHPSAMVPRDASFGYHRSHQAADSPALSDISSIPWSRRSSVNSSRPMADTPMQCDSSSSPDKPSPARRDAFCKSVETSKNVKQDFPLRPIPHMIPSDFLASRARVDSSRPSSTATSLRSTVLDFGSRNSSSFSNPRHSARGRKRGLSVSPMSTEIIDLNDIIRTSPTSLVAFINCSRTSSAASRTSGSYGHLSAASMSPTPHGMYQYNKARNPFATPSLPRTPSSSRRHDHEQSPAFYNNTISSSTDAKHSSKPVEECVSTTTTNTDQRQVQPVAHQDIKQEKEDGFEASQKGGSAAGEESDDGEECSEPLELRCQWDTCDMLFDTPKQLVLHVNSDHIQKNKKDCTCYWKGCSRARKSFKAMYMLVVHVRRHTGEKPHKCHYTECDKAYSRLENLKTHLRSHTGERPYACEFEGCTKAFSNASDRAKHQNRTHSSFKQYGCKIPGCSKRYTDPSSLRKHMKTVHGTIPQQPTKKVKGEKSDRTDKDDKRPNDDSDQQSGGVGQCLTVRPLQRTNSSGNKPNTTNYQPCPPQVSRGVYNRTAAPGLAYVGGNRSSPPDEWTANQSNVTSSGNDLDTALQGPHEFNQHSPRIDERQQMGPGVQAAPRPFLPRISGKPRAQEGLLNGSPLRRSSNASQGSVDSNYMSGTDSSPPSNTASRRSSQDSLHSLLSSRRSSLASPLPSGMSPRGVAAQTVVEGKVLGPNLIGQRSPLTPTIPEHMELKQELPTSDMNCSQMDYVQAQQHNRMSRVSSGYGSQNYYFGIRSPAPPPLDPREVRRASEGTVKRLGDTYGADTARSQFRRGSEPLPPIHADNVPRRHSLSTYAPLPVPATMRPTFPTKKMDTYEMAYSRNGILAPNANRNYIPPFQETPSSNLVIRPMNTDDIGPQFPPSEEELANGSNLFPASACEDGMMVPDSTIPDGYGRNTVINTAIPMNGNCLSPPQIMEPDSTMDSVNCNRESYEDFMVRGLGALTTGPIEDGLQHFQPNASSNMAINDMNTLIESLQEENKYFEDKSLRCQLPDNFNFL